MKNGRDRANDSEREKELNASGDARTQVVGVCNGIFFLGKLSHLQTDNRHTQNIIIRFSERFIP